VREGKTMRLVGRIVSATLIALLPELGTLNRKQVAALVGGSLGGSAKGICARHPFERHGTAWWPRRPRKPRPGLWHTSCVARRQDQDPYAGGRAAVMLGDWARRQDRDPYAGGRAAAMLGEAAQEAWLLNLTKQHTDGGRL
jgi:hypothetical protein